MLFVLGVLSVILPNKAIDPWSLLNLQNISLLIFSLFLIQIIGSVLVSFLGLKNGVIVSSFFAGIISSTATVLSLAKDSLKDKPKYQQTEYLAFLTALLAMLLEGFVLLIVGASKIPLSVYLIFVIPILSNIILIYFESKKTSQAKIDMKMSEIKILPIIKLSVFVIFILIFFKVLKNNFGSQGLLFLTFFVSLLEVHGSLIASIQQFNSKAVDLNLLVLLLGVSIFASLISKVIFIILMGSSSFKKLSLKAITILSVSLILSWFLFGYFN